MARLNTKKQAFPEYLIAPEVDAGEKSGIIYEYEPLDRTLAEEYLYSHSRCFTETVFENDNLVKIENTAYGKIILQSKKIRVGKEDYVEAICHQVELKGTDCLPLSDAAKDFLQRVQFYIQNKKNDDEERKEIDEKYKFLSEKVKEWLPPFLPSGKKISPQVVYDALYYHLNGRQIDKDVPKTIILPNGKKRSLNYENQNGKIQPVLEIIIQQMFGCFETPKVLDHPVLMKLLSPARRPLQITSDLENFWSKTWPEICREMKGRYPKHNWDYHIVSDKD